MPIYEYACDKCEHEWEVEQRMSDDPIKTCPSCRSRKVKKLISKTSFVLKGSGWYSDLYSSAKPDASKDGASDGESSTAAEASTEKKETKSEGSSDSTPKPKKGKKKSKSKSKAA